MVSLFSCTLFVLSLWLIARLLRVGRRDKYLPGGPPTIPVIGNLHIFPRLNLHLKLTEWARSYGAIYSLKLGPGTAIVLTDMTAVKDLLEKNSQTTSNRQPMHIEERVTSGMYLALAGYGEQWRTMRRVSHELLSSQACVRHISIQRAESVQVLRDCLVDPKVHFYTHFNRFAISSIMSVLYGKRISRFQAPEAQQYFEVLHTWSGILQPGAVPPIDILPFLRYLPAAFAPWKGRCDLIRYAQRSLFFGLLQETEERMSQGFENGCFMEQVLSRQSEFGLNREQVAYLGGVMIDGASDTTSGWLQTLVLAMVAFPAAQRKAQQELDDVIGCDRLPSLEDFPRLPYIQAIVKECHRWRPVGPIAIPHTSTEEINYRGFRFPTGTAFFINTWGISHDPEIYESPEDFWPDRWLLNDHGADVTKLKGHTWFGIGRRSCPGIHLANNSLIINTMNLLWAFEFQPETDLITGGPVPIDVNNYGEGLAYHPEPFMCTITPRSSHHAEVINHAYAAAEEDFAPYERGMNREH